MMIEYELLSSFRGVLKQRSPIFLETATALQIKVTPPIKGIARLSSRSGDLCSEALENGQMKMPLSYCLKGIVFIEFLEQDEAGAIKARYKCEPIEIQSLSEHCKSLLEVMPSNVQAIERIAEIEKELARLTQENARKDSAIAEISKQIQVIISALNNPY